MSDASLEPADRQDRILDLLPASILFFSTIVFIIAYSAERWLPFFSLVLLASLLPLMWFFGYRQRPSLESTARWWVLLALIVPAWLAVVHCVRSVPGVVWGRWAEICAATATGLYVIHRRPDPRAFIPVLGAAAALTQITCSAIVTYFHYWGSFSDWAPWFGSGNVVFLVDLVGPSLMAWGALLVIDAWNGRSPARIPATLDPRRIARWILSLTIEVAIKAWQERRPPRLHLVVFALGACLFVVWAIIHHRRGALVSYGLAAGVIAWWWVWRRSRPVAWLAGLAALGGVSWYLFQLFSIQTLQPGMSRIQIYQAVVATGMEGLPWGWGMHGTLAILDAQSPFAHRLTHTGMWTHHAHNDFLDAFLCGGPVGLLLLLGLCGLWLRQVTRIADPAVAWAFRLAGCAILVHMSTNVAYGTAVGNAWWFVVLAAAFAAPTRDPDRLPGPALPDLRLLQWPVLLPSVWMAFNTMRPSFMHQDASLAVRWRCLTGDSLVLQLRRLGWRSDLRVDGVGSLRTLMGSDNLVQHVTQVLLRDRRLIPIPGNEKSEIPLPEVEGAIIRLLGNSPFAASLCDTAAFLEYDPVRIEACRNPQDSKLAMKLHQARAHLAYYWQLHFDRYPLSRPLYGRTARTLQNDPLLLSYLKPATQLRLRYLRGDADLPRPILDLPADRRDVQAAADLLAHLNWAIMHDTPWAEILPGIRFLAENWGDNPSIAAMVLRVVAVADAGDFSWLKACGPTLFPALFNQPDLGRPVLELFRQHDRALRVAEALRTGLPHHVKAFEEHRPSWGPAMGPLPMCLATVRLCGLIGNPPKDATAAAPTRSDAIQEPGSEELIAPASPVVPDTPAAAP